MGRLGSAENVAKIDLASRTSKLDASSSAAICGDESRASKEWHNLEDVIPGYPFKPRNVAGPDISFIVLRAAQQDADSIAGLFGEAHRFDPVTRQE